MSLCEKEKCTGCMACYNICSHKAIKMKSNNEGFLYPGIDKLKCVNCGRTIMMDRIEFERKLKKVVENEE